MIFIDILIQVFPSRALYVYSLIFLGFFDPTFGPKSIIPRHLDYVFPSKGIWGWSLKIEATVDDRIAFLTFSKAYLSKIKELHIQLSMETIMCKKCA